MRLQIHKVWSPDDIRALVELMDAADIAEVVAAWHYQCQPENDTWSVNQRRLWRILETPYE